MAERNTTESWEAHGQNWKVNLVRQACLLFLNMPLYFFYIFDKERNVI